MMVDRNGYPILPSYGEVNHAVKELEKANAALTARLHKATRALYNLQYSLWRDEAHRQWVLTDEAAALGHVDTEELP